MRTRDIWIVDLARGLRSRFTFDRADDRYSIWSPGGDRVVFGSFRNGPLNLFQKATGGGGIEEPLSSDSVNQAPFSWSPDGKVILYGTGTDLFLLPLSADRKAVPFLPTPFTETMGQFSPDGRWVAYVSNDSGPNQVYVVPFPGPGGRVQVSANGGTWPRWRRDGSEIFYLGPDNLLMAASVTSRSGGFEVGAVQPLFKLGRGGVRSVYDVAQDGRRFLVSALREEVASLPATVVVNWTAALPQ
jgi:Tol biopolymer transport system component